ncbi:glycine-N-acyltransferase-like protein 3, partial [Emydura macquarii macquarii]|uniref:glycine-N-acyltransferase-like protein 3 n=1 Tax=Emydura macquarii macquarii TaxID=1129001 RepID=UPI00352A97DC
TPATLAKHSSCSLFLRLQHRKVLRSVQGEGEAPAHPGPVSGSGSLPLFLGRGSPAGASLLQNSGGNLLLGNGHPSQWGFHGLSRCSFNVYGTVMHVNCGNPAGQEVLVDSWPSFKIVLTRPRREVRVPPGNYCANLFSAFHQEEGVGRALLGSSHAVDWSQAFQIQRLQDGVCEAIRDIARARGLDMKTYQYQALLHPDPPAMPQHR